MELIIICILFSILYIERFLNKEKYKGCLFIEPVSAIAGLIALGTSIYQGIKGAKQKREARQLQSEADKQEASNLAEAKRQALFGLPAEQYQAALQNIYRQQAMGLGALRDRRSALAGLPGLQQVTNDSLLNLSAQDANARRSSERAALQQGNRAAGLKGQQAADRLASGQALTGAALTNAFNTASYAALSGMSGMGNTGGSSVAKTGAFGANPDGLTNRSILGTSALRGNGYGGYNTTLNNPYPTIPYASAY